MKNRGIAFLAFVLLAALPLSAQDRGLAVVGKQVTGKDNFDIGHQYAVIIGIDKYQEWPSLRSAVAEAKSVRDALADRYYIDQFFELYDEQATATAIRRLFTETLPVKIGVHDSLLVFYAGHGQLDKSKTGFWIACDGSSDQLSQNNWIPNTQLRNMIGNLGAQRILILADACFSGDFLNVNRGALPSIDSAYYRQALQLVARQVLTSGASQSVPDDSEFGRQLVSLLNRNEEPVLDPVTMYDFIRRGVRQSIPLLGSLPDNQEGACYALFLRSDKGSEAEPALATGLLVFDAPEGVVLKYSSSETKGDRVGPCQVADLPVGEYALSAGGEGFAEARGTATVKKGESVTWKPYTSGSITLAVDPTGCSCSLDGGAAMPASGALGDIAPGQHRLLVTKSGFKDQALTLSVELGKTAQAKVSLAKYAQATVSCPDLGVELMLSGSGNQLRSQPRPGGLVAFTVDSQVPVSLSFSSPYAERLALPPIQAILAESEERAIELHPGRIALPWIARDAEVSIAASKKLVLRNTADSGFLSPALPPGDYRLSISGSLPYGSLVTVAPDSTTAPSGYLEAMRDSLDRMEKDLHTRAAAALGSARTHRIIGWASLAVGLVSGAVATWAWVDGSRAYSSYASAAFSADAETYRSQASSDSVLATVTAGLAGLALAGSPLSFLTAPKAAPLELRLQDVDQQIQLLSSLESPK